MSYLEKVAQRLDPLGLILLVVGAVLVYAAAPLAKRLKPDAKEKISLIFKAAGCVAALAGALILLDFIG